MKQIRNGLLLLVLLGVGILLANQTVAYDNSVLDVARANGNFTIFVAAAEAAGLESMFDNNGPFTLLIPTDGAFAKVPKASMDALMANPSTALRQLLLYHTLQGEFPASEVVNLDTSQTGLGKYIRVDASGAGVKINNIANVVAVDIAGTNGVVHVIDTVLFPPQGWGPDAIPMPPTRPQPSNPNPTNPDPLPMPTDVPQETPTPGEGETTPENTPMPSPTEPSTPIDPTTPTSPTGNGTFGEQLLKAMEDARFIIDRMGGILDHSNFGEDIACAEFSGFYRGLEALPVYDSMQASYDTAHAIYRHAVDKVLETNRSIAELCENNPDSKPGSLDFGVARQGMHNALGGLIAETEKIRPVVEAERESAPSQPVPEPQPTATATPTSDTTNDTTPMPNESGANYIVDQDNDGDIDVDDFNVGGDAYVERVITYLEEGALPWNAETMYLDLVYATSVIEVLIADFDGVTIIEHAQANSGACQTNYFALADLGMSAPEYQNVPSEWFAIYSSYRTAIERFSRANEAMVTACSNGDPIAEKMGNDATSGVTSAIALLYPAEGEAATILGVPSFLAMGGYTQMFVDALGTLSLRSRGFMFGQ